MARRHLNFWLAEARKMDIGHKTIALSKAVLRMPQTFPIPFMPTNTEPEMPSVAVAGETQEAPEPVATPDQDPFFDLVEKLPEHMRDAVMYMERSAAFRLMSSMNNSKGPRAKVRFA